MIEDDLIINKNDSILITGANGFIGSRVVKTLLNYGFKNLRCFVRPSSNLNALNEIIESVSSDGVEVVKGNLRSRDDCIKIVKGVSIIYHLAAGLEKSFPGAFLNSVVTTRNLLDAATANNCIIRLLNVSSFTVYSTLNLKPGELLDETCEIEDEPMLKGEAYCYAKVKQEEILLEYNKKYNIPYVIMRPGAVYGPGKKALTGRIGIDTFGVFLHLGGSNRIPLSYVDNCADAIVLAGLKKGIDGEVFNVIDDNLPTSVQFLKMYKKNVGHFHSIYIPRKISYFLCYVWEKYSKWSEGQLPLAFNRKRWSSDWKGNRYSNEKLKTLLGWKPKVSFDEASKRYFDYCKNKGDIND